MGRLLAVLLRSLQRNLALFALIVFVLACAPWVQREWAHAQRLAAELPALQAAQERLARRQAVLAEALGRHAGQLAGQPVARLDAEIRLLERDIAALERGRRQGGLLAGAAEGADAMAARLQQAALREVEIELRRQARAHLLELRAHAVVAADRDAARRTLARLRQEHVEAYAAYQQARRQLSRHLAAAGWRARFVLAPQYREAQRLEAAVAARAAASERAHQRFLAQQQRLGRLSLPAAPVFRIDARRLAAAGAVLTGPLAQAERLASRSPVRRAYLAVRPVLPAAFGLLLGWWLVPAALRACFYFLLAPLAARRPPLVIEPRRVMAETPYRTAAQSGPACISAVSQRLVLAPGDELLVRPAYCQSQPAGATAATALLFDWRRPLTSIAAQLWMLTRLRTARAAEVVVSSTLDPLDEIGLVALAAGDAIVLQPRALVGMVLPAGRRPAIRSRWCIGTLHAWLTLQLRYLVFEGPATLVVKGCRGVRLEGAGAGRTVSQAATLGFSADARYGTVRAEPFLPYLRGAQPLFHDRFEGDGTWFLYEEVPRSGQPGRRKRYPLQMLADAVLKAFGI